MIEDLKYFIINLNSSLSSSCSFCSFISTSSLNVHIRTWDTTLIRILRAYGTLLLDNSFVIGTVVTNNNYKTTAF